MVEIEYHHFIEGNRIYLREVKAEDVNESYYRWMNDDDITHYTESRFYPYSKEQLRNYVNTLDGRTDSVFLAIIEKESQCHIGNIKLGNINWIHRRADIGIIIGDKQCWGKGYASEAICLLSDYAFQKLNLHKVWAGCYIDNIASIKAFEKAGFEREGVQKRHAFYAGKYVDVVLMCRFREPGDSGGN